MSCAAQHQRGFTLLEVLIALTLMAVLSLLSWRALDVTARSSEQLSASTDDTLALVRVLGQLESDLGRHADTLPTEADGTGRGATPVVETGVLRLPGIHWSDQQLTIHRAAQPGTAQEVIWRLTGQTLQRAVGAPSATLPLPRAVAYEAMLTQVEAFAVRAWVPGEGWSETLTAAPGASATGLELALARRHDGADETYRKVVLLP